MEKEKQHRIELEKLRVIEYALIDIIGNTENDELMQKFEEFVDQRLVCNESYTDLINEIITKK